MARDDDGDGDLHASDCDDTNSSRVSNGTQPEVYDGIDNDCDGVIDEGVWVAPSRNPDITVAGARTIVSAVHSSGRPSILFMQDDMTRAQFLPFESSSPISLSYRRWWLDRGLSSMSPMIANGCPAANAGDIRMVTGCRFSDSALAPMDPPGGWLLATIDTNGCAVGNGPGWLRVGRFSTSTLTSVGEFVQSDNLSNLGAGVGVRTTANCRGAARPAIATFEGPTQPFQGLVVWLDGQEASRRVLALGVWAGPERDGRVAVCGTGGVTGCVSPDLNQHIVNPPASDGGEPIPLGTTTGLGRPAVAHLTGPMSGPMRRFLVAYGNSSRVMTHLVGQIQVPPAGVGVALPPSFMSGFVDTRSTGGVDDVAVAEVEGTDTVGVVWRQNSRVRFARVDLRSTTTTPPVDVSAEGATNPTIVYASGGFIETGVYGRRGHIALPGFESNAGGWVIAWVDGSGPQARVLGRRIRAFDGARDEGEPVPIESGVGTVSYHAIHPVPGGSTFVTALVHSPEAPLVSRDLLHRPP